MKSLALILLICGLLAGPGYWTYAKYFTGSQVALLELARDGSGVWRSAPFDLTADMAAVGLILHAQASAPPEADEGKVHQNRSLAVLHRGDESAQPLPFSLRATDTAKSMQAFREHLVYMQQVKPGHYWLEIEPTAQAEMTFSSMRLEIRRNLAEPDSRVVTTGLLMFVIGLLGLLII